MKVVSALKKAIKQLYPQRISANRLREEMLHEIALAGGKIFGDMPAGYKRLFYTRDRKTVVWKEGDTTVYYQVTSKGILKTQSDRQAEYITEPEAQRLLQAVQSFRTQAARYLGGLAQTK